MTTAPTPVRDGHGKLVTMVTAALADVPAGTIELAGSPDPGTDARGFADIWLIFPGPESRQAYLARYARTWVTTATRSSYLDYATTWKDTDGYGLHLTTFRVQDIGADRGHALRGKVPVTPR